MTDVDTRAGRLDSECRAPEEPPAEMAGGGGSRARRWEKGAEWAACFSLYGMPPSPVHIQNKHFEMPSMGKIKRGTVKTATP